MAGASARRLELDYAKGLAILLLIVSHCLTGEGNLKTWIFSFHMPIFFVICGVLQAMKRPDGISVKQLLSFLTHRTYQLLIPYFVFGTVLIAFFQGIHVLAGEPLSLNAQLFALFSLQGIESMWFIPVYMIAELLFIAVLFKTTAYSACRYCAGEYLSTDVPFKTRNAGILCSANLTSGSGGADFHLYRLLRREICYYPTYSYHCCVNWYGFVRIVCLKKWVCSYRFFTVAKCVCVLLDRWYDKHFCSCAVSKNCTYKTDALMAGVLGEKYAHCGVYKQSAD